MKKLILTLCSMYCLDYTYAARSQAKVPVYTQAKALFCKLANGETVTVPQNEQLAKAFLYEILERYRTDGNKYSTKPAHDHITKMVQSLYNTGIKFGDSYKNQKQKMISINPIMQQYFLKFDADDIVSKIEEGTPQNIEGINQEQARELFEAIVNEAAIHLSSRDKESTQVFYPYIKFLLDSKLLQATEEIGLVLVDDKELSTPAQLLEAMGFSAEIAVDKTPNDQDTRNTDLAQKLKDLTQDQERLNKQLTDLSKENEDLVQSNNKLRKQNKGKDDKIEQLKRQQEELTKKIKTLTQEKGLRNKEKDDLIQSNNELRQKNKEKDNEIKMLKRPQDELNQEIKRLTQENNQLSWQLQGQKQLKQQYAKLNKEKNSLIQSNNKLKEDNEYLKHKLETLTQRIDARTRDKEELERQNAERDKKNKLLQAKLDESIAIEPSMLLLENNMAREELKKKDDEIAELKRQLEKKINTINRQNIVLWDKNNRIKMLQATAPDEDLQLKNKDLRVKNENLSRKNQGLNFANQDLNTANQFLFGMGQYLSNENEYLREDIRTLKREIAQLKQQEVIEKQAEIPNDETEGPSSNQQTDDSTEQ